MNGYGIEIEKYTIESFIKFNFTLLLFEIMTMIFGFILCGTLMLPVKYIDQIHITYGGLLKITALHLTVGGLLILPITHIYFLYEYGFLSKKNYNLS